ncbi:hypothetical protein TCSYLVIO_004396 [Trypanosoma cruzi]|uniref:HPP transmembrane region domain-containing protein n=2 Tax=Trypanosoma cruzi TaxID=5693 RepID=V5BHS6_TRYCR|nr:hypothetical protein TCSYLVIO_004396 [Trypanosoma cruzi]ESS67304.1 hypothetical protein TCDM_14009 [Trypanosoma cruzi Dm28c]
MGGTDFLRRRQTSRFHTQTYTACNWKMRGIGSSRNDRDLGVDSLNPHGSDGRPSMQSRHSLLPNEVTFLSRANSALISLNAQDAGLRENVSHAGGDALYGAPANERSSSPCSLKAILGLWPPIRKFPRWYWSRLTGYDQSKSVYGFFPSWDLLITFVFICVSMLVMALIEFYFLHKYAIHLILFIPTFGASATILFAVPGAHLAQPRALFFSHISAAILGVSAVNVFQFVPEKTFGLKCVAALVVGVHLVLMCLTNTAHPPASGTCISAVLAPLNGYYHDQGYLFVVFPVLAGCILLFLCSWILNNMLESRSPYPKYWF